MRKDAVIYIAALITSFTGVIQLIKWLRGSKPAKIEINNANGTIIIFNSYGESKEVQKVDYQVLKTSKVLDRINSCFAMIASNESIDKVKIIEQDGNSLNELVAIDRPDFELLTQTSNVSDLQTNLSEMVLPNVLVTIVKLSFEKNYKWSFYYDGFKINASIRDASFFEEIDNRITFAKGDKLIVDLRIIQEYDKDARSLKNREFIIDRVIGHMPYTKDQTELQL
jgi:hypothetical protein